MKKFVLFILMISLIQKTKAQVVFCPPGAEWHFSFLYYFPYYVNNVKIKYIKDSIVGAETVKVLSHDSYYSYCSLSPPGAQTFIKQKGDTVFFKNGATQNSWQILYNYAATAGQSWTNTISSFYNFSITVTYTFTVDSVKTVTVNNFVLRRLFAKYKNSSSSFSQSTLITERFGCEGYMFPYENPKKLSDCDQVQYFLCYQDDTFGLKQFTSKPCDYQDYVGFRENSYQNANVKIYPNPTSDIFTINTEDELINGELTVTITDLYGRKIKQQSINNVHPEKAKVDISELANGAYILSLSNNDELIYTGKLMKSP